MHAQLIMQIKYPIFLYSKVEEEWEKELVDLIVWEEECLFLVVIPEPEYVMHKRITTRIIGVHFSRPIFANYLDQIKEQKLALEAYSVWGDYVFVPATDHSTWESPPSDEVILSEEKAKEWIEKRSEEYSYLESHMEYLTNKLASIQKEWNATNQEWKQAREKKEQVKTICPELYEKIWW